MNFPVVIIGGGAAGFFAAIRAAECHPGQKMVLLEKSNRLLAKVAISGGGRCNVTNHHFDNHVLASGYPRGGRELLSAFSRFNAQSTVAWFQKHGVMLKTEPDGRIFPVSDSSASVVNCLLRLASEYGVDIRLHHAVEGLETCEQGFLVHLKEKQSILADRVIVTTGGFNKMAAYEWIAALGHEVIEPVPSLFTFNIPNHPLKELSGISWPEAMVSVEGLKRKENGPVLITHWGLSGPAILRLSAWEARHLHQLGYRFTVRVNWLPQYHSEQLKELLLKEKQASARKKAVANPCFGLPKRLWERFCLLSGFGEDVIWAEVPNKAVFKLSEWLLNSRFAVSGKTTFKEEFVTCGGVNLGEVDFSTMESKYVKGLFFAGEVLDIDGITGGYNFQAAWTTGWIAGGAV